MEVTYKKVLFKVEKVTQNKQQKGYKANRKTQKRKKLPKISGKRK